MKIKMGSILIAFFILAEIACADSFVELISKKDDFFLNINEKTYLNGKIKEKEYNVKMKISENVLYKEILAPKLNKGEVYLYADGKKTVYYPLLKQTVEKKLENEENYLMKFIKDIRKNEKEKIVNHKTMDSDKTISFNEKNDEIESIKYSDGTLIELKDYQNDFPKKIIIYDDSKLLSELTLKAIDTGVKYTMKDFEIIK